MIKVTIPFELMDLNRFIDIERGNKYGAAEAKKNETRKCQMIFLNAKRKGFKINNFPIELHTIWYTKDGRKDPDNIVFAKKFILDGMVNAKVIPNDGQKQIGGFVDKIKKDKNFPRIEIEIKEC